MPYVRGLPLDVWTRVHNPDALEVAQLFRQGARSFSVVHAAGVIHRDVKGANLLVYGEGRLVLVDFGVATYEGAPSVTGAFPPGTWPYLSPRVWRAWRGERTRARCPGDDVWALGVELYLQLTGRLPFEGSEGALVQAILREEPPGAARPYNPRVPRALGEVCWRMLRKQPGERYADALAVDAALGEALKEADGAWRVPLCEAWGPHNATTVRERDMWSGRGPDGALRAAGLLRAAARARQATPAGRGVHPAAGEPPPGSEASSGRGRAAHRAHRWLVTRTSRGGGTATARPGGRPARHALATGAPGCQCGVGVGPGRVARRAPAAARLRAHPTAGDTARQPTAGVLSYHPGAGRPGSGAPVEAAGR